MRQFLLFLICLPMLAVADDKKYEVDGIWYKLNLVTYTAEVTFGDGMYSGEVTIPYEINVTDGDLNAMFEVKGIGERAFKDCADLTGVTLPKEFESIGREAFKNCASLKNINLYEAVRFIGESAFENCTGLESVHFYEHIYSIAENAFRNCKKLQSVTIPRYIIELGACAFYGCDALVNVTLETFSATEQEGYDTQLRTIGAEAFAYCPKAAIEIPEGIRMIGSGAFLGNEKAVWQIPHSLETIESDAFQDCPVTKLYCYATKPPVVSPDAFDNVQQITLFVPYADRYKSADTWKDFGTIENNPLPEDMAFRTYPPTIEYANGQLHFSSMDDNVVFESSIDCEDTGNYNGEYVSLSATYHIRALASIPGKSESEMIHAYLCWIDLNPTNEDISTSINEFVKVEPVEVKGIPVLIERRGEMVIIKGAAEGTPVHIYDLTGRELVSGKITGSVTSFRSIESGMAIVKVGEYSIKIIL